MTPELLVLAWFLCCLLLTPSPLHTGGGRESSSFPFMAGKGRRLGKDTGDEADGCILLAEWEQPWPGVLGVCGADTGPGCSASTSL